MKRTVLQAIALFVAVYCVLLAFWLYIKPYYGYAAVTIGVRVTAIVTDVRVKTISIRKDAIDVKLEKSVWTRRGMADAEVPLVVNLGKFTFNVPITFAILAGLYPFLRWRPRILVEAAGILACVHILYIFFFSLRFSQAALAEVGVIAMPSSLTRTAVQFGWLFIDNMVIRFEPFLVAVYTYFRQTFRSPARLSRPRATSSRLNK